MGPKLGWGRSKIAVGRKPNYVPNNREEIIRIIEEEKKMSHDHKGVGETQEERDMWEPIGERPWPLRMAIPAMFKRIGKIYMCLCTIAVTLIMIQYLFGIGG